MDDVVALRVRLKDGSSRYFLTWGRILDPVDPKGLEELVWPAVGQFSLGGIPDSIELCRSLREAADGEYFYEALAAIARQPIPYGPEYQEWAASKKQRMDEGKDIWYLGSSVGHPDTRPIQNEEASMARSKVGDWTCSHFSIHSVSGDVVWLLRELATHITKLGNVDIRDVVVVHERNETNEGITGTVYFTLLDSEESIEESPR